MRIEAYIEKYGLTQRDTSSPPPESGGVPLVATAPEGHDSELFANDDATHIVVLDRRARKFKIIHGEMGFMASEWLDSETNYLRAFQPFWR